MVIVLALAAAVAYAVAMVLQRRTARDVDPALSLRPSLVTTLARRRAWQLGLAVNGVAFVLRAGALARGSLVLVQPLVLSGLVFALLLDSDGERGPRELAAAGALVAGLSLFLISAAPSTGVTSPP